MKFSKGIILAAGRGSRMGSLTTNNAKPLLPDLENSLLERQIKWVRNYAKEVIVTVGYRGKEVGTAAFKFGADKIIEVSNFGNAHFIQYVETKCDEPSLIVTSDNCFEIDMDKIFNESKLFPNLIVGIYNEMKKSGDRIAFNDELRIHGISKEIDSNIIASGLQIMNLHALKKVAKDLDDFNHVWDLLIKNKNLFLSKYRPERWFAVDTPEELKFFTTEIQGKW